MLLQKLNTFFTHIPRTGGTIVTNYFVKNGFLKRQPFQVTDLDSFYGILKLNNNVYELDHLFTSQIGQVLDHQSLQKIKIYCTVRDPVERLVSVFHRGWEEDDFRGLIKRGEKGRIRTFTEFINRLEIIKNEGLFEITAVNQVPH